MYTPATAEEKISKKNDVKAKGLLLMALPNEHQPNIHQDPDLNLILLLLKTNFRANLENILEQGSEGALSLLSGEQKKAPRSKEGSFSKIRQTPGIKKTMKTLQRNVWPIDGNNSKQNSNKSLVKEQVSQDKSNFVEGYGPNTRQSHIIEIKIVDSEVHIGVILPSKGTLKTENLDFFDMKNIIPKESLTCLVAKATLDESMLWHKRLGHINFKNINKLVKDNIVRGLPTKRFENDQTCVACLKGKQHRASCKSKVLNPITKPLFMLHMDLFGPTFVSILMHKKYCLVVTDDYSRFTWVFFLTTKYETSEILKNFIKVIENLMDKKVKIIRSDHGTEFKNKVMDDFCREKGIKREYSVARTPRQNGVAERRNMTLIEAARTMLAYSKLPTTFWAEAVSTACYVQNRVLVVKSYNKIPYELFRGFKPALGFMRPFGCHVTILNTLDSLGKFDGKSDEGFLC
ncbi:putative ribonuclease H-like domain-containing protein [Tanacetum coccineum]